VTRNQTEDDAMTLLPNRTKWTLLLSGLVCMFAAGTAAAQTNPASCTNDIECVATPQCGGDVCDWTSTTAPMKCRPAGTAVKGLDGWCTTTDDCKCKDMGATCDTLALRCTFTRPCDAPDAGPCSTGGSGGGGSSGTAGTSGGGGGGGGGCNIASTAPTAGSTLLLAIGLLVSSRRRRR
jgi:hypothetical protein